MSLMLHRQTCIHEYVQYPRTYVRTYLPTCLPTFLPTYIHTSIHHPSIHPPTHPAIHPSIHTYMYVFASQYFATFSLRQSLLVYYLWFTTSPDSGFSSTVMKLIQTVKRRMGSNLTPLGDLRLPSLGANCWMVYDGVTILSAFEKRHGP